MNHIEGLDYHALIEDKIFMEVYHEGKKILFCSFCIVATMFFIL